MKWKYKEQDKAHDTIAIIFYRVKLELLTTEM